jgi:hypothetical protein
MLANFSLDFPTGEIETGERIRASSVVLRNKLAVRNAMRKEKLAEFFTELPAAGESLHTVSNGSFDYFGFIPRVLELAGRPAAMLYGSTWTMNRNNVAELLAMFDRGDIRRIAILTGLYFKARETAVYSTLLTGLASRGQRLRVLDNHAKVALIDLAPDFYVLEGSANFTANPRIEQNTLTNSRALFDFHRAWFEEALAK